MQETTVYTHPGFLQSPSIDECRLARLFHIYTAQQSSKYVTTVPVLVLLLLLFNNEGRKPCYQGGSFQVELHRLALFPGTQKIGNEAIHRALGH